MNTVSGAHLFLLVHALASSCSHPTLMEQAGDITCSLDKDLYRRYFVSSPHAFSEFFSLSLFENREEGHNYFFYVLLFSSTFVGTRTSIVTCTCERTRRCTNTTLIQYNSEHQVKIRCHPLKLQNNLLQNINLCEHLNI